MQISNVLLKNYTEIKNFLLPISRWNKDFSPSENNYQKVSGINEWIQ